MTLDKKRNFGLDITRAFAILAVVYSHGKPLVPKQGNLSKIYTYFEVDGVPIFFVLSGFLIGNILLKIINKSQFTFNNLLQFWIRRWFRTLPTYFFILSLLILYYILTKTQLPEQLFEFVFFIQNFNSPHPSFFEVAWSLSVEEWFYLIVPALLYFLLKLKTSPKTALQTVVLITIIGPIIYRIYKVQTYQYSTIADYHIHLRTQVLTRLDSIMYGFLGASLLYYKVPIWFKYNTIYFTIGILLIISPNLHYIITGKEFNMFITNNLLTPLITIGTLFVLPKLNNFESSNWKGVSIITFISVISYSIYLLHFDVIKNIVLPYIMKTLPIPNSEGYGATIRLIRYSLYWILTIGISYLLSKYFEKPMTLIRDKFSRSD